MLILAVTLLVASVVAQDEGEPQSRVFGSLHGGVFEGSIETGSGHSLYVERAEKFFNDSRPFHSVLYSSADLDFPAGGRWCGLHGRTEEWMMDILRRNRLKPPSKVPLVKRSWAGRRLQAATIGSAGDEDDSDDVMRVAGGADGKDDEDSAMVQPDEHYNDEEQQNNDVEDDDHTLEDGEDTQPDEDEEDSDDRKTKKKQVRRRGASISHRVCNLEMIVDNTLFDSVLQHVSNVPKARELLASIIAQTVDKVNSIYGSTNFKGIEDVHFVVQHIVMGEPGDCVGYKAKHDPLCSTSLDAAYTLYLASLSRHDDYCLSYRLNYRDFSDGTLGLAWIASGEAASGGICERYRMAVERHPGTGLYKQAKMSLNTGITTLINHRQYVGMLVAALTLAHEIGHSFGAPHDSGSLCEPSGPDGKYLMYESATKGDKPNNSRFSSCSIGNISRILVPFFKGQLPREMCFQRHSGPICGNQIVEGTEECDCGENEAECTDKCCYPRRSFDTKHGCRLKSFAKCRQAPRSSAHLRDSATCSH
ncbi:hypothetical protein V5799_017968 [Amblyomma americanum]|uniref:Tumor necrosis factor-alpha-converting enzyme tace/adam17 n=1 Tax=Amblyomma americanum TaxID=6943 RepID=A0AAQ4F0K7_AMBAM